MKKEFFPTLKMRIRRVPRKLLELIIGEYKDIVIITPAENVKNINIKKHKEEK